MQSRTFARFALLCSTTAIVSAGLQCKLLTPRTSPSARTCPSPGALHGSGLSLSHMYVHNGIDNLNQDHGSNEYLRFYENGLVIKDNIHRTKLADDKDRSVLPDELASVGAWFDRTKDDVTNGCFQVSGRSITFSIEGTGQYSWRYDGTILEPGSFGTGAIRLNWTSEPPGHSGSGLSYRAYPVPHRVPSGSSSH